MSETPASLLAEAGDESAVRTLVIGQHEVVLAPVAGFAVLLRLAASGAFSDSGIDLTKADEICRAVLGKSQFEAILLDTTVTPVAASQFFFALISHYFGGPGNV